MVTTKLFTHPVFKEGAFTAKTSTTVTLDGEVAAYLQRKVVATSARVVD